MRPTPEISVELTTQELLSPPESAGPIEIDDICRFATVETATAAVNTAPADDEEVEIELTAEEMDALFEGRWPK